LTVDKVVAMKKHHKVTHWCAKNGSLIRL